MTAASVDLASGKAAISGEGLDAAAIGKIVTDLGYPTMQIESRQSTAGQAGESEHVD